MVVVRGWVIVVGGRSVGAECCAAFVGFVRLTIVWESSWCLM